MNDSNFSNYDNFFCGSAFQDLQASHISETEQSSALHYFNSLSNDLQTQQGSSVHHLQFPIASAQQVQQPIQQPSTGINGLHCNANTSNNSSSCNVNTSKNNSNCRNQSLPFVQIHTTDVQPPHSSYGNVFRRNPTNHEEIKSEPIKSESAETSSKETLNATPTPPAQVGAGSTSNDQLLSASSNVALTEHKEGNNATEISNLQTEAISTIPKIFKCSHCVFISLTETGVQQHVISSHSSSALFPIEDKQRMMCPGCENTFYSHKSFYMHLCEDHRMCLDEANKLLQAVIQKGSCLNVSQASEKPSNLYNKEIQPKIYLKNVECLRDPRHDTLDEQSIDLNDNNYFQLNGFDDGCSTLLDDGVGVLTDRNISPQDITLDVNTNPNQNQSKQKISIKSVDVLREPALLRRDFEMQSLNLLSQCNEHELHNSLDNPNQFAYSNTNENNHSSVCDSNQNTVHKDANVFEKPRRPKIYIKNVDILKEPLVLPPNLNASDLTTNGGMDFSFMSQTLQQNSGNFSSETVSQAQVFDPNGTQLSIGSLVEPFLYDGTNSNFLQNINDMDTFSMASTQNNNTTNYLLESPKYQTDLQPLNPELTTGTPLVTEPTPPPLPIIDQSDMDTETQVQTQQTSAQQKQKIFIKNVDILKQPQFQEHRRTLHLRTVDELNLMNKTEVENLIAPNLDATQNLLNQKYCENNTLNSSSENSKNSEETSFSDLNLKISEGDPVQSLNNWTNDYSLGEDLDCIITEHSEAMDSSAETMVLQKQLYDLDTPQMSVISIRDLEEIAENQESASNCLIEQNIADQQDEEVIFPNTEDIQSPSVETQINHSSISIVESAILSEGMQEPNADTSTTNTVAGIVLETIPSELKSEQSNTTSESTTPVAEKPEMIYVSSVPSPPLDEVAPVVAITNSSTTNTPIKECAVPVPPLVPVSPTHTTSSSSKVAAASTAPEKGRIYVSENLMEITTEKPIAVSVTGGTSTRGRPFGSNRTGITKMRKLYGNAAVDVGMKCSVHGCAFRFKKPETLDYHKRCHTGNASSPQSMICPECQSTNFSNWNTLHTHLWRSHKVDMELYSCELCQFKTPIYSRLVNTHSKIHSDERNYKCDQCEKAFKNSKQLKNHRRWHRNASSSTTATGEKSKVYRCTDCGSGFSHQKSLREHVCKESSDGKNVLKCEICDRAMSSKSSLKLHMLTHETANRFQCEVCDYKANDHNAFRRHKMTHDRSKMYICPYCDYKSIQSVAYQRHIQQKHPESADSIVLKCNECNFSTINRSLLTIHMVKHRNISNEAEPSNEKSSKESRSKNSKTIAESATTNETATVKHQQQKNKIKVKSDLVLTDPTKFSKNAKSTSLLVHCFDDAIT